MRKVSLIALALFVSANPATAQNWANKIFEGNPNAPVLHDFGVVAQGAQLEANLKMVNIYKVPLNITEIRVSCGCVEAKANSMVIQPNQVGNLNIKMDGTRFAGPKTVNIYVTFGPQFVSTANIVISANARQDVNLNPGTIDLGTVQRGAVLERSLDVQCTGKPAWKVLEITKKETAPFDLKSESLPARNVNGRPVVSYRVVAILKANAPVGAFRETVEILTNDTEQQKLTFVVSGNVTATITASPNPVRPEGLKLGNVFNTQVVVTANQEFRIIGMQGNGAGLNLTSKNPNAASKIHILDLALTPMQIGSINREVILQTDLRNETVKLVVQGNVNP